MINIFDLGMNKGQCTELLIGIMKELKINDYCIYGFEPNNENFNFCEKKFKNEKVKCLKLGISKEKTKLKLFKSDTVDRCGDSIFGDKGNCDETNYEIISVIKFSDWFNENINQEDFNIVKTNIEGAEYFFYNDVIDTGVYKSINIFCGMNNDPQKIPSLSSKLDAYYKKIEDHGIVVHRFADLATNKPNFDLSSLIKVLYL